VIDIETQVEVEVEINKKLFLFRDYLIRQKIKNTKLKITSPKCQTLINNHFLKVPTTTCLQHNNVDTFFAYSC